mmetsp:Transcript_14198/g.47723  ORF Transcript_14198/g.47723 Transcript_14198/m.47723 type:complete len:306 (-) Transcript_14198:597-1514(-)
MEQPAQQRLQVGGGLAPRLADPSRIAREGPASDRADEGRGVVQRLHQPRHQLRQKWGHARLAALRDGPEGKDRRLAHRPLLARESRLQLRQQVRQDGAAEGARNDVEARRGALAKRPLHDRAVVVVVLVVLLLLLSPPATAAVVVSGARLVEARLDVLRPIRFALVRLARREKLRLLHLCVGHVAKQQRYQVWQRGAEGRDGAARLAERRPELARLEGNQLVGVGRGGEHEGHQLRHRRLQLLDGYIEQQHQRLADQPADVFRRVRLGGVEGSQQLGQPLLERLRVERQKVVDATDGVLAQCGVR